MNISIWIDIQTETRVANLSDLILKAKTFVSTDFNLHEINRNSAFLF